MLAEKGTKILIIEDDAGIREGLQELLEEEGYSTLTAVNGQDALNLLSSHIPSAILLDLMMPIMDGFTFLEKVREQKPEIADRTPILILTAAGERAKTARGVKATLRKPIDIDQLLGLLSSL